MQSPVPFCIFRDTRSDSVKKITALLLAVLLALCLCSCGETQPVSVIQKAGMLNITNDEKTYLGCRSRFEAVIDSVCTTVEIIEEQHNAAVKAENGADYFLSEDYILTAFEPFSKNLLTITDFFDSDMTYEKAQETYKLESGGTDIEFSSKGEEEYNLRFVSEELTRNYSVEYDKKNDSFRFIYISDSDTNGQTREFIEFTRTADGVYLIQGSKARLAAGFNEQGELAFLYCAELDGGSFSVDESVFPSTSLMTSQVENWVNARGDEAFIRMHTLSDGVLVHSDRSTGTLKTVKMNAADYASAFYG